ncbi:hypothetical protein MLG91_14325 [Escherichia coli]|nr:hypothetical protein [Escherichia coli]
MAQLYFYYSAMNAGKSTALLQSSYNYQERGMRTVVYTAEIDDRFGAGKVSSRIGLSSPAKLFNQNSSLFDEIRAEHEQQAIHCVLVDECQFLTRQQGRPYNEGEQVVIGGNERYVSVCRKHYKEALEVGSLTAIQERHRHD